MTEIYFNSKNIRDKKRMEFVGKNYKRKYFLNSSFVRLSYFQIKCSAICHEEPAYGVERQNNEMKKKKLFNATFETETRCF